MSTKDVIEPRHRRPEPAKLSPRHSEPAEPRGWWWAGAVERGEESLAGTIETGMTAVQSGESSLRVPLPPVTEGRLESLPHTEGHGGQAGKPAHTRRYSVRARVSVRRFASAITASTVIDP